MFLRWVRSVLGRYLGSFGDACFWFMLISCEVVWDRFPYLDNWYFRLMWE
jgi:hypothetical protein